MAGFIDNVVGAYFLAHPVQQPLRDELGVEV